MNLIPTYPQSALVLVCDRKPTTICTRLKRGGLDHSPPKFEHKFVAVINFFPFFCADTFITSLLLIVGASR